MPVIWAVYRRKLGLPAGKTGCPVQWPRCPCVAPSRQFSRIAEVLGAHSPPNPSAERASTPSEPQRAEKVAIVMPKKKRATLTGGVWHQYANLAFS